MGDRAAGGLNDDATSSSSLGPTDFAKICQHCGGDLRLTSTDLDDVVNAAYVNALNTLLNALRTAFPNKIDIFKITGCKQQPGKTVGDFLTRLTVLFNQHSGIPIPDNLGNQPGAHETHLKQAFLNGLLPPLRADVGHTCIGLEDARLTEVRCHSEHAERQHKETKDKTQQKKIQPCQGHTDKITLITEPTSLSQEEGARARTWPWGEASLDDPHLPEMSITSADKKDTGQSTAPSSERRGRQELSLPTEVRKERRRQTGEETIHLPAEEQRKGSELYTRHSNEVNACNSNQTQIQTYAPAMKKKAC